MKSYSVSKMLLYVFPAVALLIIAILGVHNNKSVVLEFETAGNVVRDTFSIRYSEVNSTSYDGYQGEKIYFNHGYAKWISNLNHPCLLILNKSIGIKSRNWFIEPGDRVKVRLKDSCAEFSGTGSEKFSVLDKIEIIKDSLSKKQSIRYVFDLKSVDDFLRFNNYLNLQQKVLMEYVDGNKTKLSDFAYNYIRNLVLDQVIDYRSDNFYTFLRFAKEEKIPIKDICRFYDSVYAPHVTKNDLPSLSEYFGSWAPLKLEIERKYLFDSEIDDLNKKFKLYAEVYDLGIRTYKSIAREKFRADFLTNKLIKEFGFIQGVEGLLDEYYAEASYSEAKKYVKKVELSQRILRPGKPVPDFSLTDSKNKIITKNDLQGKIAVLTFERPDSDKCIEDESALLKKLNAFGADTNFIWLNIATDVNKENWERRIFQRGVSKVKVIDAYADNLGARHSIVKTFNVLGYPGVFILNAEGKLIASQVYDASNSQRNDSLLRLIGKHLAIQKDGPFISYKKGKMIVDYIDGGNVRTEELDANKEHDFVVQTNRFNDVFKIRLKKNITAEECTCYHNGDIFTFSDIEGDFDALWVLLRRNNIIDDNNNWTFGKGHVVCNGNLIGGGGQTTECLWLLYSLEEKAKAVGGYVHVILGANEIETLSNKNEFASEKYKKNSTLLGLQSMGLYAPGTELGRWLRSKNIMETVGDVLFVSAGISKEVNDSKLSISQLNNMARPYYDKDSLAQISGNKDLAILFDSKKKSSPFKYKLYYLDQDVKVTFKVNGLDTAVKASVNDIDNTLQKFKVHHVVTGYTRVAGEVSVHYNGKVINTFSAHRYGISQALLIKGNDLYRVTAEGRLESISN